MVRLRMEWVMGCVRRLLTGCPRGKQIDLWCLYWCIGPINRLKAFKGISELLRVFGPAIVLCLGGLDVSRTSGIVPC